MTLTVLMSHKGEWPELAELVVPEVMDYCARHGYKLEVKDGTYHDESWGYTVQKTKWIRDFIRDRLADGTATDFYWSLDMDTLITNQTIPVLKFTDDWHDVFMCRDVNGINSGSYIVRACDAVVRWFDFVLALRELTTSEQHAMQCLSDEVVKFQELPHPSINSIPYKHYSEYAGVCDYGGWHPGHLLVHLPGKSQQERVKLLTEYLEKVVR